MAYKNGTYVAFNGYGTTDPTESDIKYYNLLKAWAESDNIDFSFSNSHEKTSQVSDESKLSTLKARLQERLRNSKNMLLIITEHSAINRGLLNWEIEQAITVYNLPIIVAYTGHNIMQTPTYFSSLWPKKLKEYIDKKVARTIHIGFTKESIKKAINDFSFNALPQWGITIYK